MASSMPVCVSRIFHGSYQGWRKSHDPATTGEKLPRQIVSKEILVLDEQIRESRCL
jgi:hypothetical protein